MTTKHEDLTAAEERYLQHAAEAKSQGVSLRQYYRAAGLRECTLYNVRRRLIRKGVVASRRRAPRLFEKPSQFVAVQLAAPARGPVCRMQHPSGWVIECASWPEPSWMAGLMGERT